MSLSITNSCQPLTCDELALAKAQRLKLAGDNFMEAMKGNCDEIKVEASKALDEAGGFGAFTKFLPIRMIPEQFIRQLPKYAGSVTFDDKPLPPTVGYNLPTNADLFNKITGENNLNIGRNSIINLKGMDFNLAVLSDHKQVRAHWNNGNIIENESDEIFQYANALRGLVSFLENVDSKDTFYMTNPEKTISLLEKSGIDTNRNFGLNGIGFEISGNTLNKTNEPILQNQGNKAFTIPANFNNMNPDDLNRLLERAYSQGLL